MTRPRILGGGRSLSLALSLALAASLLTAPACSTDDSVDPRCTNGARDGDELGVDCGGSCAPCAAPGSSTEGEGPPGPADGKKNGGETDVDCGGPNAPPCDNGKACAANTDCKELYCADATKQCTAPRTDDGVKNGSETDVDCGGTSGALCAEGKACKVDGDCKGACRFDGTCVDAPSCKPRLGGATCGAGEVGSGSEQHESCCRTLEVPGFTDAARPGKKVYLDKYEITAGRVRAFIEHLAATGAGDLKSWIAANRPPLWDASFDPFLATSPTGDTISVPHKPTSGAEAPPWLRNVGTNFAFNGQLFVYVHGHNCGNAAGSYGFPTFFYPNDVQALNGGLARADGFDGNGVRYAAKDYLDVKSATCIPNVVLAAFCHWDGGQLATDEVLDFVTNAPPTLGSAAGCGTRCAPLAQVNATGDSGQDSTVYRFPYFANDVTHEGTFKIAAPGRVQADRVRINANDEPWQDLHGNVHEAALDVNGATFTGKFALKYRGIGYSSARAGGNSTTGNLTYPEYKAGYTGGRCMRFE